MQSKVANLQCPPRFRNCLTATRRARPKHGPQSRCPASPRRFKLPGHDDYPKTAYTPNDPCPAAWRIIEVQLSALSICRLGQKGCHEVIRGGAWRRAILDKQYGAPTGSRPHTARRNHPVSRCHYSCCRLADGVSLSDEASSFMPRVHNLGLKRPQPRAGDDARSRPCKPCRLNGVDRCAVPRLSNAHASMGCPVCRR